MAHSAPWESDATRIVVGIGDAGFVSGDAILITHGLGTCIGVAAVNYPEKWGALLHFPLPHAEEPAPSNPYRFGDTGIREMLAEIQRRGWGLEQSRWSIIGGASPTQGALSRQIAADNITVARQMLRKYPLPRVVPDVGGRESRTVRVEPCIGGIGYQEPGKPITYLVRATLESCASSKS